MNEDTKWPSKTNNTGKHKCKICKKKFTEKGGLDQHIQLHSSDKPYACHLCTYTGKTQKYLNRHVKLAHVPPTANECSYCGKKFHYLSKLNEHLIVHTNSKPYKCDICGKGFNSSYSLGNHNNIHKDSKPFKCLFCDYACRDSSTLRKHHERHTGIERIYQCGTCLKSFKKKYLLRDHVSEVHLKMDLKTKPCRHCDKMFKSTSHLTAHIQRVHEKIYKTRCDICDVTLSNRYNMDKHLRSHLLLRPFLCGVRGCGKTYKDKSALQKHSIIHYPEKHLVCKICDKRFTRVGRYRSHVRQHRPREKSVVCDHCGVSFYSKNYLRVHMINKHLARRRYVCDHCGFCAHNKPGLVKHLKTGHDSELDRRCKICNKTFKKHVYLKSHYWNTHFIKYKTMARTKKAIIKQEPLEEPDAVQNLLEDQHGMVPEADINAADVNALMMNAVEATSEGLETLFMDLLQPREQVVDKEDYSMLCDSACEKEAQKRLRQLLTNAQRTKERKEKSIVILEDSSIEVNKNAVTSNILSEVSSEKESQQLDEANNIKKNVVTRITFKDDKKKNNKNGMFAQTQDKTIDTNMKSKQLCSKFNEDDTISCKMTKKRNIDTKNIRSKDSASKEENETYLKSNQKASKCNQNSGRKNGNVEIIEQKSLSEVSELEKTQEILKRRNSDMKKKKGQGKSKSIRTNVKSKNKSVKPSKKLSCFKVNNRSTNSPDVYVDDCNEKHGESKHTNQRYSKANGSNIETTNETLDDEQNKHITENNKYLQENEVTQHTVLQDLLIEMEKDVEISPSYQRNINKYNSELNENIQNAKSQDALNVDSIDHNEDFTSQSNASTSQRMKFNSHQCYECFRLFETKEKLLDHCKEHYDLCNETILKKCPLCDYVTNLNLARHIKLMHKVEVRIGQPGLKEKVDESGIRYFYNVENEIVNKIDVIPSVKNLNKRAYMKLDKLKRQAMNKAVQKDKLVKKDKEWIVEKCNINIKADGVVIPDSKKIGGDYFEKLKMMATLAKNEGKKLMYPCNNCEKICQTLAALKLHYRHHDPHKKPFKPKVWKHKMKGEPKTIEAKDNKKIDTANRYKKPKPIVNKHKCDPKLKEFYENNIKGGDIEFWQFLKIYNKMSRENVKDFKDLENRLEFGTHLPEIIENKNVFNADSTSTPRETISGISSPFEPSVKVTTKVKVSRLTSKNGFKRVVRISRKEFQRRNKIKQTLRDRIRKMAAS